MQQVERKDLLPRKPYAWRYSVEDRVRCPGYSNNLAQAPIIRNPIPPLAGDNGPVTGSYSIVPVAAIRAYFVLTCTDCTDSVFILSVFMYSGVSSRVR